MSDFMPPGADPVWQQMMMEYMMGFNPMDPSTSMLGMQPNAPTFAMPDFQNMYGVIPQDEDSLDFAKDSANYLQDYANIQMDPALWMSAGTSALSPNALAPQTTQAVIDRPGMRALEAYRSRPNTFEGIIATEILDNGGTGNSAISKMRQVIESVYDPSTGEVRRELPEGSEGLDPELVAQADEYRRMLGSVTIDGIPTVDYNTAYDNAAAMERAYLEDPQPGRTGAIYNEAGEMVSQGGELTIMYDENGNEQLVETRTQEAPLAEWLRKNGLSSPYDQYDANDFMSGDWMAQQQQYNEGESTMRDAMEAYQRESDLMGALQRGEVSPEDVLSQFDPDRHVVPPVDYSERTRWADDMPETVIDPDALRDQWGEAVENGAELPGTLLNSGVYMPDFTSPSGSPNPELAPLVTSMNENIPQVGSATNWSPEPGHIFPGEAGYDAHLLQHQHGEIPGAGQGPPGGGAQEYGGVLGNEGLAAMQRFLAQSSTPPTPGGGQSLDYGSDPATYEEFLAQQQAAGLPTAPVVPPPVSLASAVAQVESEPQRAPNYGGQWPGYQSQLPGYARGAAQQARQPGDVDYRAEQGGGDIPPVTINGKPNPEYQEYLTANAGRIRQAQRPVVPEPVSLEHAVGQLPQAGRTVTGGVTDSMLRYMQTGEVGDEDEDDETAPMPSGNRWRRYTTGERGWQQLDLDDEDRTRLEAIGVQAGRKRTAKKERNRIFEERKNEKYRVYNHEFGVAQARSRMAREAGITPYQQQMLARRMVPMAMGLTGSGYLPGA